MINPLQVSALPCYLMKIVPCCIAKIEKEFRSQIQADPLEEVVHVLVIASTVR